MAARNTAREYGWVAKSLHWAVVAAIATLLSLGLYFDDMASGPDKEALRNLHVSFGLLLLVLMLARLGWRQSNVRPADPPGSPHWQNATATWLHRGLYLLIFVQMTIGALIQATVARPLAFFGLFEIYVPMQEDHDLHELLEGLHKIGWIVIVSLVTIHIVAALYHHFVLKDDVLRRMGTGLPR